MWYQIGAHIIMTLKVQDMRKGWTCKIDHCCPCSLYMTLYNSALYFNTPHDLCRNLQFFGIYLKYAHFFIDHFMNWNGKKGIINYFHVLEILLYSDTQGAKNWFMIRFSALDS